MEATANLWTVGGAIIASLISVIGLLWKIIVDGAKERQKRLDMCEAKHEEHHKEMRTLSSDVARLRGEREGHLKGVEEVISAVLDRIDESRKEDLAYGKFLSEQKENKNG